MNVYFDEHSSCYEGSGFYIDMPVVPREGEIVSFHRSVMNQRFFNDEGFERFVLPDKYAEHDDGTIFAKVLSVGHYVNKNREVKIVVDLDFDEDNIPFEDKE